MVIRASALVTDCAPGKWEKSSTRDAAVGPFFPAYNATRLRTEPFDGTVSAYNPSVLSKQDDPESYLSSAGSLAAESFRHQVHSFKNSPEQQKLPHLDRMRALQNHLESVREQIMHDHILQPVPE